MMLKKRSYNDRENGDINDDVSFISIVGVGGLGNKATLAKSVYNDERAIDEFDSRLWGVFAFGF